MEFDFGRGYSNLEKDIELNGSAQKARILLKQSLEDSKKTLGVRHPDTVALMDELLSVYIFGKLDEKSDQLLEEVLAVKKATLGKRHPDLADWLIDIAMLNSIMKRYDKVEYLNQALDIRKEVFGDKSLETADALHCLDCFYQHQELYDKAEPFCVEAFEIGKETLGEKHPKTVSFLISLANLYEAREQYHKAEILYERAMKIREETLGKEHSDTADSMYYLASFYNKQGLYKKAEPLLREATLVMLKYYGAEHWKTELYYLCHGICERRVAENKFINRCGWFMLEWGSLAVVICGVTYLMLYFCGWISPEVLVKTFTWVWHRMFW